VNRAEFRLLGFALLATCVLIVLVIPNYLSCPRTGQIEHTTEYGTRDHCLSNESVGLVARSREPVHSGRAYEPDLEV